MQSVIGAILGLAIAIFLIIRKFSPVYSLLLGAVIGGLVGGLGLNGTVANMISGVKDITPAIIRIIAAGVLSGVLIKSGAAASISRTIVEKLGERHIYLALALSTMLLTGVGVFIDVAVITFAPIAILMAHRTGASKFPMLLAMVGGGKCGNIISPNPNTIIAAENFNAPLSSVMAVNIGAAVVGLIVTVYVIIPLLNRRREKFLTTDSIELNAEEKDTPSFLASIAGPIVVIALLALRPIAGIAIDPLIALPAGGLVAILATRTWKRAIESISYGLEKMSTVAVLLVSTGALAGIIKASALTDLIISLLGQGEVGRILLAPLSAALMSAATASTTAGATIASASFAPSILSSGLSAVWGAALVNVGSTVLDHLPHGSFFHATGGAIEMNIKERLRLIPYESCVGLVLTLCSIATYLILG
jgi:GntP family gluconate:H+ symporter